MKPVFAALFCILPMLLPGGSAFAGGKQATRERPASVSPDLPTSDLPTSGLPGVDRGYSIVTPLPAEPDDTLRPGQFGQFRVGNFDVKVSGKLTFDIGVGNLPAPRR